MPIRLSTKWLSKATTILLFSTFEAGATQTTSSSPEEIAGASNVVFGGDHTLTISTDENDIFGTIRGPDNQGTISISGDGNVFHDEIGDTGAYVKEITTEAGASEVTFNADVKAYTFTNNNAAGVTVNVSDGFLSFRSFYANIVDTNGNTITLNLQDSATQIYGNIGSALNPIAAINVDDGGSHNLRGVTYANTITVDSDDLDAYGHVTGNFVTDDAELRLRDNVNWTGNISTTTNNTGTVRIDGNSTISGTVGGVGQRFATVTAGGNGTTTTFQNDIHAQSVTTLGTGNINVDGHLNTDSFNFAHDATLTVGDDKNINTPITTSTNNTGTVTLSGTSTVTGTVGTSSNRLKTFSGGATGETVTVTGDVFATTVNVTGAGDMDFQGDLTSALNFNGDGDVSVANNQDFSGSISTATDGEGTFTAGGNVVTTGALGTVGNALKALNLNGDTVTLSHDIAANNIGLTGSTLTMSADRTFTGNTSVNNGSRINIGGSVLTATGNYTHAAGSTLGVTITDATTFGRVDVTGNAAVDPNTTIDINVINYVPVGAQFKIIDGNGGAGVNVPLTITDNSSSVGFTATTDTQDLILVAFREASYVLGDTNTSAVGTVFDELATGVGTSEMDQVMQTLGALGSNSAIEAAMAETLTDTNTLGADSSINAMNGALNTIGARLDSLRISNALDVTGQTGIATGDVMDGLGYWMRPFGSTVDQDTVGNVAGHDANTVGIAVGGDTRVGADSRLGMSFSYAKSDIQSKGATLNSADVESFQVAIYGATNDDLAYFDWMFGYAFNDYQGKRNLPTFGEVAEADFDGVQYTLKLETGKAYQWGDFNVTPMAALQYAYLHQNAHTEENAGALNLSVDAFAANFLQVGLGGKLSYPIAAGEGHFVPEIKAMWLYEAFGEEQQITNSFTGGGSSFRTTGISPEQHSANVGLGLAYRADLGLSFSLNYDAEFKSGYQSHSGQFLVRYDF